MPSIAWLNGSLVDHDDARVSAFDAGLQHAIGLFETMHASRGRVFRVEQHLKRLADSAKELGLSDRLRTRALEEAVQDAVNASQLAAKDAHARVRLTVTGGDMNMLNTARAGTDEPGHDPTVLINVTPMAPYPDDMFTHGVGALIAPAKANPFDPTEGHKTLNYWWRLRALQEAARAGMGEALVLSVTNHVCGGAVSNIFVVKDGALLTPLARDEAPKGAIAQPVLPGITRRVVMECAEEASLTVEKRLVTIDDVLDADELFLTNSAWGVLPLSRVEQQRITDGVGDVTKTLRDRWLERLDDEA